MTNLRNYREHRPQLQQGVYIDPAATVIGKVQLDADSSVWPRAVLRGDVNHIAIGARSNIQDGCIVHVSRPKPGLPEGHPTQIGDDVTIGHGVILHGCTIA
ncbi:MAG: gamma carbonic anhydrase family protein, partial [Pseudomonadales bacterium]|nr:gamma carbonic anhydrase family protein [Pseudomonadales bacterium]